MEALERLKTFCLQVESGQFQPTEEAINVLGNALIESASIGEGYTELTWQAGFYLLMESENADDIYARFGYQTVACALRATLSNGTFPLGLGFITYDFLPPSGGLEFLVKHPCIQEALGNWNEPKASLIPESFRAVPQALLWCETFLEHAEALRLPLDIHLQIVACLLLAARQEAEKKQITSRLLDVLTRHEKPVTLFLCWQAACDAYPALLAEPAYGDSLLALLKVCRDLPDQGAGILIQLRTDPHLPYMLKGHRQLSYLMGLAAWWLFVRHQYKECKDTAFAFTFEITETCPELGKVLRSFLQEEQRQKVPPEEIESMRQQFQVEMRKLEGALHPRVYRGLPVTLEIQHYNARYKFTPIYEALDGSSELTAQQYAMITELDANKLLDENPVQKGVVRKKEIVGNVRQDMIRDYESVVASARRALDLRQKLLEVTSEEAGMLSLVTPEIIQEVLALQQTDPELQWIFPWFVPEITQAIPAAEPTGQGEEE